ncbi:unnamed protein product [Blepharisma stoltei]|uniref:Flavodoxin-like fold domain-containing protein n=1 Tax=Blepharisma stoltei TaxID=1481888 RepID=A0AAU9IGA4_9CILI|nr:unnamed protein product [Blepharisma stoltei]
MKALIVYAHPSPASFSHAVKESLKSGFIDAGWEIIESDLYKMGYKACLDRYDYPTYTEEVFNIDRASTQALNDHVYDREIEIEMDKIRAANVIAFQFPIWWSTTPAILTGWLQRNFPIGFGWPDPVLSGKKVLIACTAGNNPKEELEAAVKLFARSFEFMGAKILPYIIITSVNTSTQEGRENELANAREVARETAANFQTAP